MLSGNNNVYRKLLANYNRGFFAAFSKSKTFIVCTIISILYLVTYTWSGLTCICIPCESVNVPRYKLRDHEASLPINYSSPKIPLKINSELQKVREKCPTNRPIFNYNLRNLGPTTSNEEMEFVLNIRKLILFSVHELNKPLKNTGCVQFWANPLDLSSYEEISKSDSHIHHKIKFIIQPGNFIYLLTEIRQKLPPVNVNDTELEIVSPFELLNAPRITGPCGNSKLSEATKKICICSTMEEVAALQKVTEIAKGIWNSMDPELQTWKPQHSFMVEDYMNFTNYEDFVKSPGNTKEDIRNLKYSNEYCGPKLKMLVMIKSAPTHFHKRRAIRETFGSAMNLDGKRIKVVFLVGLTTNTKLDMRLQSESMEFKDIIQPTFQESYHNLTLGHLSMYKWIQLTCGNGKSLGITLPKYILKADDDYLLNVDLALRVAEANPDAEFIGYLMCGTNVVRRFGENSFASKYYIPRYMYISGSYIGYFLGIAFILRSDVVPRLLHAAVTTPMIHMDDVYVTGMLLRQLKIYPRHSRLFTAGRVRPDACITKAWVSSNVANPHDMLRQWMKLLEPQPPNCVLDNIPIKVQHLDAATKRKCFY